MPGANTDLGTPLDPEQWRDRAVHYHRAIANLVTRFGSTAAKYLEKG